MNKRQRRWRNRIVLALALFVVAYAIEASGLLAALFGTPGHLYAELALFLVPYLVAGHDVLVKAARNVSHGEAFDESLLMTVATIGAFAMVLFPESGPHMAEGAAVMIFYQVGELFQSYAVGQSRRSIAQMMDIAPDCANIEREGRLVQVDPAEVAVGDVITVKPGERVPIDGVVVDGSSSLDTAALTGEPLPREVGPGDEVVSGCVNMTGLLRMRTTKPFGESTVSRILELVENASERKARTESFITRFARVYTPLVTGAAALIAVVPPLLGMGPWADWVLRGLTFLVVSCPCALVISVPLSFFGGIGGASRLGILVKGSNYLEALSHVGTVVFDKTGTLTSGTFRVTKVLAADGFDEGSLLRLAAQAEAFSDHPVAASLREACAGVADQDEVTDAREEAGRGVVATVGGRQVLVGNARLMDEHGVAGGTLETGGEAVTGTVLRVAVDGAYAGSIVIADEEKPDAREAVAALHAAGVRRCVMLTGDRVDVARAVAADLGIDEVRAQLLPEDKVCAVEELLAGGGGVAFVGDGINDAPVLARADVGIAMGAMGSDAAIEAADVVLMDDRPSKVALAMRVAKRTMRIVWENIVFAIGVKVAILVLAALGLANMWLAVFGDVGVAVIAILNAMRCMRTE